MLTVVHPLSHETNENYCRPFEWFDHGNTTFVFGAGFLTALLMMQQQVTPRCDGDDGDIDDDEWTPPEDDRIVEFVAAGGEGLGRERDRQALKRKSAGASEDEPLPLELPLEEPEDDPDPLLDVAPDSKTCISSLTCYREPAGSVKWWEVDFISGVLAVRSYMPKMRGSLLRKNAVN